MQEMSNYYHQHDDLISFTRVQASKFAKRVANDFNPIHDVEAKKFCVPGDLLFAVFLHRYGLFQQMQFNFSGMVNEESRLRMPDLSSNQSSTTICNIDEKACLEVEFSAQQTQNNQQLLSFIQAYVQFSGNIFPHLLVPLMQQEQVMINPTRPLVMYQSMHLHLQHFNFSDVSVRLHNSLIKVDGKRAKVSIAFDALSQDHVIVGQGEKNMILSGLRPYEQDKIDVLVSKYIKRSEDATLL